MNKKLLIDTDIIIDYLRDYNPAVLYLEKTTHQLQLSTITVAELYAGIRDNDEQKAIESFLAAFDIVSVNNAIAQLGGTFRKKYGKSHGTGLADALIAATAVDQQCHFATLNTRHYPMLKCIAPYEKNK
ncbi:MAG: type II toxin-antitoxin system VapC family toxin [Gammaproteobacteria bacterium]|nr:type II toxin-antitoxin system VapC family toxin [Gammaproteobacteria bacterium]